MSKEVSMTLRVEPDLRASFTRIAEGQSRSASEMLREYMRAVVIAGQSRTAPPLINAEEQARRESALSFAKASIGLEGLELSPDAAKQAARFIKGEIDLPALMKVAQNVGRSR